MHENGGGRHGSEEAGARRKKAMIAAIAGPAAKMIV